MNVYRFVLVHLRTCDFSVTMRLLDRRSVGSITQPPRRDLIGAVFASLPV